MIDGIFQGLTNLLVIVAILGVTFFLFILSRIPNETKALLGSIGRLIKTAATSFKKAVTDSYTKEEMIENIGYFELRGNKKSAEFWREQLNRKFPEEK